MMTNRRLSPWISLLLAILIVGLAVMVRWPMLSMPLQFDEQWSWWMAQQANTPLELVTEKSFRHDNNHLLNTWYLQLWDGSASLAVYRLHSLAAGCLMVAAAMWLAWPHGAWSMVFTGLLLAANPWWVIYSTQARGYSLAGLMALLAWWLWDRYRQRPGWLHGLAFGCAVILGFLGQLHFLSIYLALSAATVMHWAKHRESTWDEWKHLLRCHALPILFLVLFYVVFVHDMELGGGPRPSIFEVLTSLFGQGCGFYPTDAWHGWAALGFLLLLVALLGLSMRLLEPPVSRLFWLTCLLVPAILFLAMRPPFLFERYFLLPYLFCLVLMGMGLGRCAAWRWGWVLPLGLCTALVWNSIAYLEMYRHEGRGRFADAIHYILIQSPQGGAGSISVAADYDFRVEKLWSFEVPRLDLEKRLNYVKQNDLPPEGVAWFIEHRVPLEERVAPWAVRTDRWGHSYRQAAWFRPGLPVDWDWIVYRRIQQDE